ncbi:MAG: PAC2 family protein [Chloroflexi bacterium]|nr:PAC2 family protein [Chloroflexota bacterium]MCY3696183.1 PAC2 family protein [Chloroflexota bacterium]MXX79866.1 PAC2 family protein [Chloroflexota bacterium]MYF23505.1 PAC2 family protein [Chloroflexota bacterium]
MTTSPDLSINELPDLTDPILILAWEGWNDAGESASTAAQYLIQQFGLGSFATIDPEEFYDFTEVRPMARYRDGERYIDWPATEFVHLRPRGDGRDIVVGIGIEPQYRWKRYMTAMSELVEAIGAKLILSLGAVATGAPHTMPVHVRGSANNSALAQRYNMHPSRFEGPSGIVGVFHDHCRRQGVGGVSLWASVPHYLPGITNPVGAQALLRVVSDMTGLHMDYEPLERGIQRFHQQLEEALRENTDLRDYVARLEAAAGTPEPETQQESELPSADALIADLEDFFRQGSNGGDSGNG